MALRSLFVLLGTFIACNANLIDCGQPAHPPDESRVVGGHEAQANSWPWQVSLQLKQYDGTKMHWCGGSLIHYNWVVTAAHCVEGKEAPYLWEVWLGAHDNKVPSGSVVVSKVAGIFKNPYWNPSGLVNDIALIKLATYFTLSDEISTVCLPAKTHTAGNGFVTGWGEMQYYGQAGWYPDKLQQVMTPIIDHDTCVKVMQPYLVDDAMVCAGFPNAQKGACSGDSGGPFVVKTGGRWELAGIVSWGLIPCAQNGIPSIYTDPKTFESWIYNTISSN
ncbi:chymotrypsinogen A-like [Asterias rubens]|uniref:chymotrypsinogen A-like n=1 Tax=Asterias rubens TaxID=7604 RepID=UPI001455B100|nr:chymotrypsinogen A-like [Asterias rubens]XP_033632315.1 chymotrypsinogen A-like [Asterias rubens]